MREDIKGVSERDTHEVSHQRRRLFEGVSVHPSGSGCFECSVVLSRGQGRPDPCF